MGEELHSAIPSRYRGPANTPPRPLPTGALCIRVFLVGRAVLLKALVALPCCWKQLSR